MNCNTLTFPRVFNEAKYTSLYQHTSSLYCNPTVCWNLPRVFSTYSARTIHVWEKLAFAQTVRFWNETKARFKCDWNKLNWYKFITNNHLNDVFRISLNLVHISSRDLTTSCQWASTLPLIRRLWCNDRYIIKKHINVEL